MTRPAPLEVRDWVRTETPEHMALLSRLRAKLAGNIDEDVTERGTPSRDWCRAFQRYQAGWIALTTEERERVKLKILAKKAGEGELTDEDFERELRELGLEVIRDLPMEALTAELARRGTLQQALRPADPPDEDDEEGRP